MLEQAGDGRPFQLIRVASKGVWRNRRLDRGRRDAAPPRWDLGAALRQLVPSRQRRARGSARLRSPLALARSAWRSANLALTVRTSAALIAARPAPALLAGPAPPLAFPAWCPNDTSFPAAPSGFKRARA